MSHIFPPGHFHARPSAGPRKVRESSAALYRRLAEHEQTLLREWYSTLVSSLPSRSDRILWLTECKLPPESGGLLQAFRRQVRRANKTAREAQRRAAHVEHEMITRSRTCATPSAPHTLAS
jgi:hypothetical protein